VYALLDHLVNLPHPPQVLYLPPLESPLPQELLTILHAIRLSSSKTGPIPATPESPENTAEPTPDAGSAIPSTLHCEPLPRSPEAIKEFIRKWAIKPPGTADDGRRIDGIVWADEWDVRAPWKVFATRDAREGADTWAEVKNPERGVVWTAEQGKFHFLNSILPFLLKAPMERSIRLVNVLGPFYPAAVPLVKSSPEEQARATDQLLVPGAAKSPVVQSGRAALRNILLWRHLQRVVDALASVSHNEAQKATAVPVPDVQEGDASSEGEPVDAVEGLRRRKGEAGEDAPSTPAPPPTKRITVQSNILALPVVIGFNRWGIVRPLMGLREGSYLGWAL
jgi:hypothetical protein